MIIKEFEARKERVRQALAQAKSKIHVSFDLWTSPASVDCVAVVEQGTAARRDRMKAPTRWKNYNTENFGGSEENFNIKTWIPVPD